jgi:hypothetical protein
MRAPWPTARLWLGTMAVVTGAMVLTGCGASAAEAPPPGDALDTIEAAQLFHFGNQLAESGDSIRAEQYLSAAMARGYPEGEVIPRLMEVCVQASRLSAALSYAEPYLDRHEREWPLRMLVATIQMSLNHTSTARVNLERVLEQVPDEPEPHYLMGVLLRDRLSERAASNEHFARYIELAPDGRHVSEARLSIEGRFTRPTDHSDGAPRREPSDGAPGGDGAEGSDETDAPAGPTRLPAGATPGEPEAGPAS